MRLRLYGNMFIWSLLIMVATETPHHKNAFETTFEKFPLYFGKSFKTFKKIKLKVLAGVYKSFNVGGTPYFLNAHP